MLDLFKNSITLSENQDQCNKFYTFFYGSFLKSDLFYLHAKSKMQGLFINNTWISHLSHSGVVWLVVAPVGVRAKHRPISPGERALNQEVLETNPPNFTSYIGGYTHAT